MRLHILFIIPFTIFSLHSFSQVKVEFVVIKIDTLKVSKPVSGIDTNKIFLELLSFRQKEAKAVADLWEKHGSEIGKNDSITLLNKKLFKALNDRNILFFRKYPNDYSMKIFRQQVIDPSVVFMRKDTGYFRSLIDSFESVFPKTCTNSFEGKEMIQKLEGMIKASEANQTLLPFSMNDNHGKLVTSNDFKNKYILLDFWASWCGPCRGNNPLLKSLHNKYHNSNFELISISSDQSATDWKAAIDKDSMDWTNLSDLKGANSEVAIEYGISAYPTYILIDPSGKVILRTENEIDRIQGKLKDIFE